MGNIHVHDTIASVATGSGPSGIVLIRVSGPDALRIADRVFIPRRGRLPSRAPTHTVHYGWIADGKERVDEVLLTVMRAPRSYTREDVVEIGCHGGMAASQRVLSLIVRHGARPAQPGEFTKRAFLNGRIDLSQAEAVADIVNAKTEAALAAGMAHLGGALSSRLASLRETLITAVAELDAGIDFPQEETEMDAARVDAAFSRAEAALEELLSSARAGRIIREGMRVAICGRPNAGKSSLLNALLKEERSIVTPVPGTTRDAVDALLDIRGVPVTVTDTAGILRPRGIIEKKAMAVTSHYASKAQLILFVVDGSRRFTAEDEKFRRSLPRRYTIGVINKTDLAVRVNRESVAALCDETVDVSAKKRRNIMGLEEAVYRFVFQRGADAREAMLLVNGRQQQLLEKARACVVQARKGIRAGRSAEFVAQDAKDACAALDEISGKVYSADVIDRIFSRFCIGK